MRILLFILFTLILTTSFAQKLSAKLSEPYVHIGEPIILEYKIEGLRSADFDFQSFEQFLPSKVKDSTGKESIVSEIEILSPFEEKFSEDKKSWSGSYVIVCWDSSTYMIPSPRLVIEGKTFLFDDLVLKSDLVKAENGKDIYDIREVSISINKSNESKNPPSFWTSNWWWVVLIVLLIIGLFLWLFFRKKQKDDERVMSLRDSAIMSIENLEKAKMWEQGRLKEHFVELSYILRKYLSKRYNLSLLELTTSEICLLLERKGLERGILERISEVLNASDMVKFAKSEPEVYLILKVSASAKQIINETSPLEFENA